jgi:hypothetical protein
MLSGGQVIISRDSAPLDSLRPLGASASNLPRMLAVLAALSGSGAWVVFFRQGLVLSHYDAKAHLVVARRVFDNLTPGWQQIGAVWLPLPHILDLLPVQVDLFYRTGLFASIVSIACLAITCYASARLVLRATGSSVGAITCGVLVVFNPNLLYLHTTPMTEPLLLTATLLVVLWLLEWVDSAGSGIRDPGSAVPWKLGCALFAAMWTRYEAWPVVAAAIAAAGYATWRRGASLPVALSRVAKLALWPASAVAVFLINSRITVGAWFVSDGFYVVDPTYARQPWRTLIGIWWGTHQLSGYVIEAVALVAAAVVAWRAVARRPDASLLITLALFATAALPFVAFYDGHPYRIRYMIPTAAACALFCGLGVGILQSSIAQAFSWTPVARTLKVRATGDWGFSSRYGGSWTLSAILLASLLIESPPWNLQAPMLLEAQWDRGASAGRREVTSCLARDYRGEKVLASMGSLAHYMQELSANGFHVADFINEGNGEIWNLALATGPAPHAGWMLVEEVAEGGDVLAAHVRNDPEFTAGMRRVCEGGGVALYRRDVIQDAKFKMQTR